MGDMREGCNGGPGFGVPIQCTLVFWVHGSGPLLPHQTDLPGSRRLSRPLARLEQDSLGHYHQSWTPIAPLTRPWEAGHPSQSRHSGFSSLPSFSSSLPSSSSSH